MATASASPGSPVSSNRPGSTRTRARSPRLVQAAVLLGLAAVLAVGVAVAAVTGGLSTPWPVAAGLVVLALGAAATRATHREVLSTRREGATDRATMAKQYRAITDERVAESTAFADTMRGRIETGERTAAEQIAVIRAHEAALDHRERRLAVVEAELEEAKDRLAGTESLARAQSARADDLAARLASAETTAGAAEAAATEAAARAATTDARLAELEAERDALRAELHLWQSAGARRRQA